MKHIVTSAIHPPIPTRGHDWSAYFDWDDGGETVQGFGESERDAVLDLFVRGSEVDDDGSLIEELIDCALYGWTRYRDDAEKKGAKRNDQGRT